MCVQQLRKIKNHIRHSWGSLEIERSVELLQETKTGGLDPAEEQHNNNDGDNFGGLASVARIVTRIETNSTMSMGKVSRGSRISLLKLGKAPVPTKLTLEEGSSEV